MLASVSQTRSPAEIAPDSRSAELRAQIEASKQQQNELERQADELRRQADELGRRAGQCAPSAGRSSVISRGG